jgi:hypothetical protein
MKTGLGLKSTAKRTGYPWLRGSELHSDYFGKTSKKTLIGPWLNVHREPGFRETGWTIRED